MGIEKNLVNGSSSGKVRGKSGAPLSGDKISLIKPGETLIKEETSSVIVRNKEGKLVRRTSPSGTLPEIFKLIKLNEVFVSDNDGYIVVRNEAGKLVKRKTSVKAETKTVVKTAPKPKKVEAKPTIEEQKSEEDKSNLRSRLLSKHAFLDRIDRGESVSASAPEPIVVASENSGNADIEEIEEIEEIAPDKSVQDLEKAVTKEKYARDMGRGKNKGVVGTGASHISSGAINPNEKPMQGVNGKLNQSLAGNVSNEPTIVIAQPERVKPKKEKKKRKPLAGWVLVSTLVGFYLVAMLVYFFVGYNFAPKKVDIILYYVTIGEDAKLKYYDGEKINTTDMLMTFYYTEEQVEHANLVESNLAEATIGMGYTVNNKGYITALWQDGYEKADSREVKLKFNYNGLISYVPVTIYRNKLTNLKKQFVIPSLSSGLELIPTIYGVYTNDVLNESGESIQRELSLSEYDLVLKVDGEKYSLKQLGAFDGTKYVMPEKINGETVDYSSNSITLTAVYLADGYNGEKPIELYSK